jgi:hypothetical protein
MNRALGGGERQWWLQSKRVACNIGLVTCIEAPVDRGTFERALPWLQRRYPLLAASLAITSEGPRFVSGHAPPIALTWKERTGPDDWRPVGSAQMAEGFPDTGPFVRFVALAGADATDVLLTVSHMAMDGLSMAQLMADVLRFLDDPARPAEPVVDQGQLDERAPKTYRKKWLPFARHLFAQVASAPHDPARNARLAAKYHGREKVDWITLALPPEDTERLRLASRAEGTTVQGALTAAMAMALGEREARRGRKKISVHSPINLRKLLEPPVVDEIGNFAAGTTVWVPCNGALWDIARTVKSDIDQAIARGAPFANERLAKGAKRMTPRTSPRWLALRLWPDLGVTNLGQVTPPETLLGAKVREMHVIVTLPVMETLVCATVTVRGRLICDFLYCPDDISREEMLPMVEAARGHLRTAMDRAAAGVSPPQSSASGVAPG